MWGLSYFVVFQGKDCVRRYIFYRLELYICSSGRLITTILQNKLFLISIFIEILSPSVEILFKRVLLQNR